MTIRILAAIIALETAVLIGLTLSRYQIVISHGVSSNVNPLIANPLYGALEYESPDAKFESLVKQHPDWMLFIPPGASNSILSLCAESKRTNYIRILIANGANLKQAIIQEEANHNEEAVRLLQKFSQN